MLYSFKARALLLYLSSALARRGWPRCWRLEEALAEYQRRGGTCEAEYDIARDDPIMVAVVKHLGTRANDRYAEICIATVRRRFENTLGSASTMG